MTECNKKPCFQYLILFFALSVGYSGLSFAREVNKCQVENEKGETVTVFSYAECGENGETHNVHLSTGPDHDKRGTVSSRSIGFAKTLSSKLKVGESCDELSDILGNPNSYSVSLEEGVELEKYTYLKDVEAGGDSTVVTAMCLEGKLVRYDVKAEQRSIPSHGQADCSYWRTEYQKDKSEYSRMMAKGACENAIRVAK